MTNCPSTWQKRNSDMGLAPPSKVACNAVVHTCCRAVQNNGVVQAAFGVGRLLMPRAPANLQLPVRPPLPPKITLGLEVIPSGSHALMTKPIPIRCSK